MSDACDPGRVGKNPMLSELPFAMRRILHWDVILAGLPLIWALAVVLISIRCGAAWIAMTFSGESKSGLIVPYLVKYGYLVELNHGFFYLLLAPTFLCLASHLVLDIDTTVNYLVIETRLQLVTPDDNLASVRDVRNWIAKHNRLVCGPSLLIAIFAVPFVMIFPELDHVNEAVPNFGWVQSVHLPRPELRRGMTLGNFKDRSTGAAQTYKHYDQVALKSLAFAKGRSSVDQAWFWWLFWLALIMENCFVTFAIWVGIKIMFLLGLLSVAFYGHSHPKRRDNPFITICLNLHDAEQKRFGLSSLDKLYRGASWLVLITTVAFYLQQVSNVSRGPLFAVNPKEGVGYPQVAALVTPIFVMVDVLIVPATVCVPLLRSAKERELGRLAGEIAKWRSILKEAATNEEAENGINKLAALDKEKQTVEEQTPWPKGDKQFLGVVAVAAIVLFVGFFGAGGEPQRGDNPASWIIHFSRSLPALIDEICK